MRRKAISASVLLAAFAAFVCWLRPQPIPRAGGPLPHDVYVWQRTWNEPVVAAVLQHAGHFSQCVALGAEVEWTRGAPRLTRVAVNFDALRAGGRSVGLALRIGSFPGPFVADDERARWLADIAHSLLTEAASHQLPISELQIDFDCAESKLAGYQLWVEAIRHRIQPVPTVITALPAWLQRASFRQLAGSADAFVLQVHSLERPKDPGKPFTLCDLSAARKAIGQAARFGRPFRVALPTYGYSVGFDPAGKLLGLSAEGPSRHWPASTQLREVSADPEAMATLVRDLTRDRPECLRGVIWYRLPVANDHLNWSWATLETVMTGQTPQAILSAQLRRPSPGLFEVDLHNTGTADQVVPASIGLSWNGARVIASDGLLGFEGREGAGDAFQFSSLRPRPRLRPGETRTIGWLRLDKDTEVALQIQEIDAATGTQEK